MRWKHESPSKRFGRWHDWFAWYPVQLSDGSNEMIWWEWIRRQGVEETKTIMIRGKFYLQTKWNWSYVTKD